MIPLKQTMEIIKIYLGGIFMASPYAPEFRAKVSQEYLDGGSYAFLAEKYNIGKTTIQQWVAKYRIHGIAAGLQGAVPAVIVQMAARCNLRMVFQSDLAPFLAV